MKLHYRLKTAHPLGHGLPVLFIHGLFGSLDNLGALVRPLCKNHCTLQIDLRNHGLSPHALTMRYDEMAQDVLALLDTLLIERCIVIGHSMGGKVAMKLCTMAPIRIAQAVVIDMAPVVYQLQPHNIIFAALLGVREAGITQRCTAARLMEDYIDDSSTVQFLLKSFCQGSWRFNLEAIQRNYADIIGWKIQAPWLGRVLFIFGGNSMYLNNLYREVLYQQFPQACIYIVADAGHCVHVEKPEEVLHLITGFLADRASVVVKK
ncbi:alpha/beta fold hydrolase [Candidatus Steffania adelgidicola]|uniref:alpha/beta fold hydrolase n=1 Tax=Candidatus Steffania adelgidicola TaxID=1076626 RepID=UPI001D011404|nr:alpha/beta fold hydrolase [Candidatus Steffania adelgidicola]UDG79621.1 Esterase YbfF [Candidatus Steffania adelgidicola]